MKNLSYTFGLAAILFVITISTASVFSQNASCYAPGNVVSNDSTELSILPYHDIEKVYVSEPLYGDGGQRFAFSMKVRGLRPDLPGVTLPLGTWNVVFSSAGGTTRYVQMSTMLGSPTFSRGTVTTVLGIPVFNSEGSIQGTLGNDGMIIMSVDKSLVGSPQTGTQISVSGRTFVNTIGIGLVSTDDSASASYSVAGNSSCSPFYFAGFGLNGDQPIVNDYDRNGSDDVAVWRPSTGVWYSLDPINSSVQALSLGNGLNGDIPVPGNYDNDTRGDLMVYRPSEGNWYLRSSETGITTVGNFGLAGDIPLSGDYDGDRLDDIAVWRPSTGAWYILRSSDGGLQAGHFGLSEDRPLVSDFDGDRKMDVAVFRPSTGVWYWLRSSDGGVGGVNWGLGTDVIAPGDYDGDGKADPAVYRPESGHWYILKSNSGSMDVIQWGIFTDKAVPGDYNGNGRNDIAVWRPETGVWYIYFR